VAEPEAIISESEQHKKDGNMYFASADYVKAVAAYNKAIKSDPKNGVLYSNRAAAFIHLGKETKAIKDAEQAIELKPDWAKGYFRKGAALAALRKWDEAIEVLEKAVEVDPKSKEIATMLRETTRKRNAEKGAAKRAEKGSTFKFDLSKQSETKSATSEDTKDSQPVHIPAPQDTGREFVGCGTQSIVETFLTNSLTSAITQFASQGELKSVVYVQPATPGGELQVIGVEAGFDSPQANSQCCDFLRTYALENKALAMIVLAEKKNVAYPQVWKQKSKSQWKWKDSEHGIFMQLDALAVGAVNAVPERKVWFIPTGSNSKKPQPGEPVQLDIDQFAIMPPLLRALA